MLSQDSLKNDKQKELHNNLKRAIESRRYPKSVLGGNLAKDINAVLGTRITTEEDGLEHNFLTYAIKYNNYLAAADIFTFATTSLKDLLEDQPVVRTYEADDGCNIPFSMTALEYAREQANKECEQLIIENMKLERMSVPAHEGQSSVDAGRPASSKASATSAIPSLPTQPHGGGSVLTDDSLEPEQKMLHDSLRKAIIGKINDNDIEKILTDSNPENIQAVLSTYVLLEGDTYTTFLMFALEQEKVNIAEYIVKNAGGDVIKLLLTEESIMVYKNYLPRSHTALSYAREQSSRLGMGLVKMIEEKMQELGLEVPAYEDQSPVDLGATPVTSTVGGHDQQRDNIRNLYIQLYSNIVNDNPQVAKDSLNALLKQDNEKFKKVVDFKERGMVSLRENIQQKLQDLEYNKGDQELIEILETCVDRISQIVEVPEQPSIDPNGQTFQGTNTTPATPSLLQQDGQDQPQDEGSMLIYNELTERQQTLYNRLYSAIAIGDIDPRLVDVALYRKTPHDVNRDRDLERVLSTWVKEHNTFLTLPAKRTEEQVEGEVQTDNRKKSIEAIWDTASTNVRDLWVNASLKNDRGEQVDIVSYLIDQQKGESDTETYNGIIQEIQKHKLCYNLKSAIENGANVDDILKDQSKEDINYNQLKLVV